MTSVSRFLRTETAFTVVQFPGGPAAGAVVAILKRRGTSESGFRRQPLPTFRCLAFTAWAAVLAFPSGLVAQTPDSLVAPYPADRCPDCAAWNEATAPFQVYGNTWFVGTRGLSALLITSPEGHVLLDGGLPDSAPLILANIRARASTRATSA